MEENYLGYLLNALDADEQATVEREARNDPEAARRLELLRQAVEPLAADAEQPRPPADLVLRTLARVAEARCRELPRAPAASTKPSAFRYRSWRRIDVLVAAGLLIAVASLAVPVGNRFIQRNHVRSCQDNLRQLHGALVSYTDLNEGEFPFLDPDHPRKNFAGMYVVRLNEHGLLTGLHSVTCPANGRRATSALRADDLVALSPEEFEQAIVRIGGCYAYSLGYIDAEDGRHRGLRRDETHSPLPIMADKPPESGWGNSPNHGGSGQNVLFVDGHVQFTPARAVGVQNDDIYVNKMNKVAPGVDRWDSVLGASNARPGNPAK